MSSASPAPSSRSSGQVTRLLQEIESGRATSEQLLPIIYEELRRLAASRMKQEALGQTLQPTALVHEAYLRLINQDDAPHWDSRGHFFSAAAEAMRRILVENARRKQRVKHGGRHRRVAWDDAAAVIEPDDDAGLLALDAALSEFATIAPEKSQLVKLRYFAGLSEAEAAEILGISRATAARWWAYSRAWLYNRLAGSAAR